MPSGAQLFIQTSRQLGLDRIFTLVGDHLNEVLAEARAAAIPVIDMRHESAVAHAADAWARITRKPALSLVTGGPGHTNSLTGIATAQLAGSPLIAVSGSRPTTVAHRQSFQDIQQLGMTLPVVKWAAEPSSAGQIPHYLSRAYREASSGRPGAVHLTIPVDIFLQPAEARTDIPRPVQVRPAPSEEEVRQLVHALRQAERPVVIAGSGIWWSGAEDALRHFIEHTQLPLFTITMARGVVDDDHPLCFGYADPALSRGALRVFAEADLILLLGKRLDYRLGLGGARVFSPGVRLIQVDIHAAELGLNRQPQQGICADLRQTLETLLRAAGSPWPRRPWIDQVVSLMGQWRSELESWIEPGRPMHPGELFLELRRHLPADVLLSWDGGDFVHWGRALIPAHQPGGWLRLGPLGTIGAALPNAISLQLAHPNRRVLAITGDGALGFYLAELDTAVRFQLPIVILVGNDAGWGLERELQAATGKGIVACELRPTGYDIVAQGFGGRGETIDSVEQLRPALERAFSSPVPYLINARIRGARSPFTRWQIEGKKQAQENRMPV